MSLTEDQDISYRNLFRQQVLLIAEDLENGEEMPESAVERLRSLCASDVRDLDESDIDIDFDFEDTSGDNGPLIAALAQEKPAVAAGVTDPVEIALSRVISLRDRINSLKIVATDPGQSDIDTYRAKLRDLRDALASANLD